MFARGLRLLCGEEKQRITFEYILIDGVNDRAEDAVALGRVARRIGAKVNCIPYNTVEGLEWKRPSEQRQDEFMAVLEEGNVERRFAAEKGHDIAAACRATNAARWPSLREQESHDADASGTPSGF
jgi:23S rRNA (adenine2503-C2)-methyltransferase